jgi:hypothetical protein
VTARIQTYTSAIIPAVLFELGVLISAGMTTSVDGQAVDKEKINRQLDQVIKALDSGDTAAAVKYLEQTDQELPSEEARTLLAINGLIYLNDTEGARINVEVVRSSLQNSTGWQLSLYLDLL